MVAMTTAVQDCAGWLYGLLEPDATLRTALGGAGRVYDTLGPQWTASNPGPATFVIYSCLSALPVPCLGPTRAAEDFVWLVKVVGRDTPFSALEAALNRIEALLWATTATSGSWQFSVYEPAGQNLLVRYVEPSEGGPVYRHVGRQWLIAAAAV